MSWMNAIKAAAKTVGKDVGKGAKFVKAHADKALGPVNEFAKDSVAKSPWLTAALAGGTGMAIGNAMNKFDNEDYPPELQEVIVQLRAKGASDEEIQQYLDQLMEVGE